MKDSNFLNYFQSLLEVSSSTKRSEQVNTFPFFTCEICFRQGLLMLLTCESSFNITAGDKVRVTTHTYQLIVNT